MFLGAPPPSEAVTSALTEVGRLRRFAGPPAEFWPALVVALARLVNASRGILIVRDPKQPDRLRKLGEWAADGTADRAVMAFSRSLAALTEGACRDGEAQQQLDGAGSAPSAPHAVAVPMAFAGTSEQCVAAFLLPESGELQVREALVRLRLAADVPAGYQTSQAAQQARQDVEKFASVMDVMVLVNAQDRFRAAALALCNGLADRFPCDRVSLGWLRSGYVRLQAISRTERFNRKMAAVQALEVVMEEALDQDDEVVWPKTEEGGVVARDHERFAREQGVAHLASVPMRHAGKGTAVLTVERQANAFSAVELQQLRLACDQASSRLRDLHRSDRWFGVRWALISREWLAKGLGAEHTWAKVLALLGVVVLVALVLPVYPYRVEGNFILRSDEVSFLTAPFDGFVQKVEVRPGDELPAGGLLLALNTDDLALEEAAAIADQTRYLREAEKARAQKALAEMRIAQALADQAKARLDLVRYRLQQAGIRSPFPGVVVEGDWRQRVGAPVRQGDGLYKVARTDALYVEAEINERDVHEMLSRRTGEIAFVAQPRLKFPVTVVRVEPAAMAKPTGNVFLVRAACSGKAEPWWRPGMSGVCKLDVERRTLIWILTHRTVDFLRLYFWW